MKLRIPNWKRFSLRSLFVLTTLCCLLFGAWAVYVNPYRIQMQALDAVNRLNAVTVPKEAEGPALQRWLVTRLLGDAAFVRIAEVNLSNRPVADRDLRSLAGLCFLEKLSLDYTKVTDVGIFSLPTMRSLKDLSLKYTNISDRGVEFLSKFPNLQHLILTGTKISDASIDDLASLHQTSGIFIRWTHISNAGADRLRQALPECDVFHHALVDNLAATAAK